MGTLYKNIITLCQERGIKGGKMCTDLGISKGLLTDLKMGRRTGVSAVTAQKIAGYFNVSVAYLLGEETEKAPTTSGEHIDMSDIDIAFYGNYKELSDDDQKTIRDMVRVMRERRANQETSEGRKI